MQVFRALHAKYQDKVEVVAINDLFDAETNFHLLEYDKMCIRDRVDEASLRTERLSMSEGLMVLKSLLEMATPSRM